MTYDMKLSPVQRLAFDRLLGGIACGELLVLRGAAGAGKTAILERAHATMGGAFVGMRQFIGALGQSDPLVIEEAFLGMLEETMLQHSLVFVDDLHLVTHRDDSFDYSRSLLLDAGMTAMFGETSGLRRKLVFGTAKDAPWPVRRRAHLVVIGEATQVASV